MLNGWAGNEELNISEDEEIDGALITKKYAHFGELYAETEDGRNWVWDDSSYGDADTGYNLVPEGDWIEEIHMTGN